MNRKLGADLRIDQNEKGRRLKVPRGQQADKPSNTRTQKDNEPTFQQQTKMNDKN